MTVDQLIQETQGMTDDMLVQVINFARFLRTEGAVPSEQDKRTLREAGRRAGQIIIADDFDAPLDDFKEYM